MVNNTNCINKFYSILLFQIKPNFNYIWVLCIALRVVFLINFLYTYIIIYIEVKSVFYFKYNHITIQLNDSDRF